MRSRFFGTRSRAALASMPRRGIVAEMQRHEGAETPAGAPTICLEEGGPPNNHTHWYAVWDRFAGVGDGTRSRIVLGAIREALGQNEALRAAVAMGLTPEEAEGMGLAA